MSIITSATSGSYTFMSLPTVTALLALTTPFIAPSDCPTVRELTSFSTSISDDPSATLSFLVSNPANSNYALCQPSGWGNMASSLCQSFSPAVCPSGWWAFDMATTKTLTRTISTASCCMSGYSPPLQGRLNSGHFEDISPVCVKVYEASSPTSVHGNLPNGLGSATFSTGIAIHPAWHISWEVSDVSILSPRPPELTSAMKIPTWVPGDVLVPGMYDNGGTGSTTCRSCGNTDGVFFLMIGLPVILVFLLCGCCTWCYCARRRSKTRQTPQTSAPRAEQLQVHTLDTTCNRI